MDVPPPASNCSSTCIEDEAQPVVAGEEYEESVLLKEILLNGLRFNDITYLLGTASIESRNRYVERYSKTAFQMPILRPVDYVD